LRALGLRPNKRLSQSFLEDQQTATAIVQLAELDGSQDVLEVGPGLGVLTGKLGHAAREVVAVEIDPQLADSLRRQFASLTISIVTADILTFDPSAAFDAPFVVVGNLPYHITSPTIRHLLLSGPPFAKRLIFMLQAEVAERIAAAPGSLSALAVAIQVQASARVARHVPRTAFYPRPKVDSAVLVLIPIPDTERVVSREELSRFVELVQAVFKQPRKQLANSLADGLGIPKHAAIALLTKAGIDASLRPQDLAIANWVRLFRNGT